MIVRRNTLIWEWHGMILWSDLFDKVSCFLLGYLSCCWSCHLFLLPFFHVMLENSSAYNPGLYLTLDIFNWEPYLSVEWPFQWLFVCLSCFSALNSFTHSASLLWLSPLYKCCSKISYFVHQTFRGCYVFHSTVGTLFLILLEQSFDPMLFNSLIIPLNVGGLKQSVSTLRELHFNSFL